MFIGNVIIFLGVYCKYPCCFPSQPSTRNIIIFSLFFYGKQYFLQLFIENSILDLVHVWIYIYSLVSIFKSMCWYLAVNARVHKHKGFHVYASKGSWSHLGIQWKSLVVAAQLQLEGDHMLWWMERWKDWKKNLK